MFNKNNKDPKTGSGNKKKSDKQYHDEDDIYRSNKINKEFKRKKQNLKEEEDEDWNEWSEYYNR